MTWHTDLVQLLEDWRGKSAYFERLHGNNGDKLIELGALELVRRSGLILVTDPNAADVVLFNGGAGLTDVWHHGFATLAKWSAQLPDTPLVVFPSTIQFVNPTIMRDALAGRRAPAYVFCREAYSMERMRQAELPQSVELLMEHDAAFALSDSDLVRSLKARQQHRHNLIVERSDREANTPHQPVQAVRVPLKRYAPVWLKRTIKRRIEERSSSNSPFALACKEFLDSQSKLNVDTRNVSFDVSMPTLISFDGFCRVITQSNTVITTRLHVGIFAALLGKDTYVVEGISELNKIRGIYEHSLCHLANTKLVRFDGNMLVVTQPN